MLEPGKGASVELEVKVSDLQSYDTYDKNNNGFMGYEVEEGEYNLSLRVNSHEVKLDKENNPLEFNPKLP